MAIDAVSLRCSEWKAINKSYLRNAIVSYCGEGRDTRFLRSTKGVSIYLEYPF
jgi:hypothetical protein